MSSADGKDAVQRLSTQVAEEIHDLVGDVPIGSKFEIMPSADLCYSLELFIPALLRRRYPEWERESLDGIFVAEASRTAADAVQIVGTCILISDQKLTPFFLQLRWSSARIPEIRAVRVGLGEPGLGRLGISGPPCNSQAASQLQASLAGRMQHVDWRFVFASEDHQDHQDSDK